MSFLDKLLVAINFIRCWQQYLIPNIMSSQLERNLKLQPILNIILVIIFLLNFWFLGVLIYKHL
jgi:hypothetical protein